MDTDDRQRLKRLIYNWTWTFGLLAVVDVLAPLLYWARYDADPEHPVVPPVAAVIIYIAMAVATGLAYGGRSRVQWNLQMADLTQGVEGKLAAVRADIAALAEAIAGHEDNRDRRDGLQYAALGRIDTRQRLVHQQTTEMVERDRERDTEQLPAPRPAHLYVARGTAAVQDADELDRYSEGLVDGLAMRSANGGQVIKLRPSTP